MHTVLFGDQQPDCRDFLQQVFNIKDNIILKSLLDRVAVALHQEINSQPYRPHCKRIPRFSTVKDLVEQYYATDQLNTAVESAILCLAQLSHFICYIEEQTAPYIQGPTADHRGPHILGACTGLISASAIASANSLTTLLPLAVEAVRVAFRTGLYVGEVAERLQGQHDACQSWSTIVATSDKRAAEDELNRFNQAHAFALSNKLWISAYSPSSVTISGPPSKRKRLFDISDFFSRTHHLEIKVNGPYHANHLHNVSDVENIIDNQTRQVFSHADVHLPIVSSVTAKPIATSSPIVLLKECLNEILWKPLRWDLLVEECTVGALAPLDRKFHLHAFGPTVQLADNLLTSVKSISEVDISKDDTLTWLANRNDRFHNARSHPSSDIAIVGMSGRFPDAADLEKFWTLLEKGLDVHREVPADRYNVQTHTDPTSKKKNTSHTPYGNFIENPGLFDARFFNMSPREANQTDPMQRLELVTAYEAMQMAGIVPGRTDSTKHERIGTFYGMTSDDWREINAAQDIDTYFISGGVRAFGAGRINYYMKFSGPSFIIDTACSSSFAAIQLACTSLRQGDCDTAFSGGANVLTNPDIFSGLSRGHFLSKTGNCKTFDNDADGYCRGDGVATVILKRMDDALADNDPILGVIRGAATNHSADAVSITHPHAGAQISLFNQILRDTNTNPFDVSYVEMHGTGTQAGDAIEMESVSTVFAPRGTQKQACRSSKQPLYLGSVKSNIGHGEAVSGVCALIKILLMLQQNQIPPHCGIKGIMNKTFPNLEERNINIALKKTSFPRPLGGKRTVFINNFSAAGGNTGILLEDAPEKTPVECPDPRPFHVVTVSAKSLASFRKNLKLLQDYLSRNPSVDLSSISYTTTARRLHYSYRASFAVSNKKEVSEKLANFETEGGTPVSLEPPKIAFAFTGQGSQYARMGKQLLETSQRFRSDLESFDKLAQTQGFPSVLTLVSGFDEDINSLSPVITQLGMACVQMALVNLWNSWGIKPVAVVGHSLGEYAALYAAGVLSAADAIFLVGARAQRLEIECTRNTHAMLAVKSSPSRVQEVINGTEVNIACINSNAETVLSGRLSDIDSLSTKLRANGMDFKKLNVPYAFHSSQVDPALKSFQEAASAITFNAPQIPILSPLLSVVIREEGILGASYLVSHCREKVNFRGAIAAGTQDGLINGNTLWIEIGAHPVCSGMVKASIGESAPTFPSLRRGEEPWKTIANSISSLYLAGANPDWPAFHQQYESSLECLPLPTYAFDERVHWLQYVNDWTLTKGDPVGPSAPVAPSSTLSTTSIHKIVREDIQEEKAIVVAESDIGDPALHKVISGHTVNGIGLCPSSLYADMALTLTDYAYKQLRPGDKHQDMNVHSMQNPASLIVKNVQQPQHQIVTIESAVDLSHREATVTISSKPNGKTATVHAKCVVSFEDASRWASEWDKNAFLIRTRVDLLHEKLKDGRTHRLPRGVVYRLFASMVEYSNTFQGMKDVILDSGNLEATAEVELQATSSDGCFYLAPYTIDSIGHLAGFILNGSGGLESKNKAFISHGWESMRLPTTLQAGKRYHTWVKMQPHGTDTIFAGDVYLFDESAKIIGLFEGLKFQVIPRQALNIMLPPAKSTGPQASPSPVTAHQKQSQPSNQTRPLPTENKRVVVQSPKPASSANDVVSQALSITAAEVGVGMEELADAIQLADLGIDSLMTLTIAGRFREDLGLEIDNNAMNEVVTIGELKKVLSSQTSIEDSDSSTDESSDESDPGLSTGLVTPISIGGEDGLTADADDAISVIRTTLAEQMDIEIAELTETLDLSTIGMDSLMALTVLGALRETTGREYEPSLFAENTTIAALRNALSPAEKPKPSLRVEEFPKPVPSEPKKSPARKVSASSILLQGNPKIATQRLFLLPDGSGSPTSYADIPPISANKLCVYGLTCPFLKEPTSFTCGVQGVTKVYIEEIIRRQPEGPYLIGGWSAGGVFAFEATRQLAAMQRENPHKNFKVDKLLLLDSPCPYALEPLPSRLHIFFNEIGLLGDGNPANTPKWLLPHFQATIDNLKAYKPVLIEDDPYDSPPTFLVWCRDGVCKYPDDPRPPPQDDDPLSMKWLLNNRTDFGPNGWDKLIGDGKCTCVTLGGNHFTMMKDPVASELQQRMKEGLGL